MKEKKWFRTKYLIKYYLPCQSILVIIYIWLCEKEIVNDYAFVLYNCGIIMSNFTKY